MIALFLALAALPSPAATPVPARRAAPAPARPVDQAIAQRRELADIDRQIADLQRQRDAQGDLTQAMQQRLQMLMDRHEKLNETLSNIMKKLSDTDQALVGNMK